MLGKASGFTTGDRIDYSYFLGFRTGILHLRVTAMPIDDDKQDSMT